MERKDLLLGAGGSSHLVEMASSSIANVRAHSTYIDANIEYSVELEFLSRNVYTSSANIVLPLIDPAKNGLRAGRDSIRPVPTKTDSPSQP